MSVAEPSTLPVAGRVGSLPIEMISGDVAVAIPSEAADALSAGGREGWLLVTVGGVTFPAGVRAAPAKAEASDGPVLVRMGMALRTVVGCEVGDAVLLRRPTDAPSDCFRPESDLRSFRRPWPLRLLGRLDGLLERALRPLLGAPAMPFRVAQVFPGDDIGPTARLHESAFDVLGLRPGDEIIVRNGPYRVALPVFREGRTTQGAPSEQIRRSQAMAVEARGRIESIPEYLLIRLSAQARLSLLIPRDEPHAVVEVRRRLLTRLGSELNRLVLPVGGLIVAALALESISPLAFVLAGVAVVALSLAPVRRSTPSPGPWPPGSVR